MRCAEFLKLYSDFRDGLIEDHRTKRRLERHLRRCLRCARHHATLERGLGLLQTSGGDVVPSSHFRERLQRRLQDEIAVGDPLIPTNAGMAAAFVLAAGLGLILYEGVLRPPKEAAVEPPPAAEMTRPAALPLPIPPAPAPEQFVDVTLPAFGDTAMHFRSEGELPGTWAVFTP